MPEACCSHSPDAPGWFEAHVVARGLVVLADGAAHDQAHRQRGVDPLLAGARLDEVGASHHAHQRALRYRGVCVVYYSCSCQRTSAFSKFHGAKKRPLLVESACKIIMAR